MKPKAIAGFALVAVLCVFAVPIPVAARAASAIVLVNSSSVHYSDFEQYLQPYLDHFGVPYTIHDIVANPVTPVSVSKALIIVGHSGLDDTGDLLDSTEQTYVSQAVFNGAGLVNSKSKPPPVAV